MKHTNTTLHRRRGVTLTEVLMSLMIMSIGVVSVATLFPIAALRSAQATRLTNGAILKYNVEGLVRARPELIFDPDGDYVVGGGFGPITEHFRQNALKRYVVDPSGYFSSAALDSDFTVAGMRNYLGATVDISTDPPTFTHLPVLERYDGGIDSNSSLGLPADIAGLKALATDLANLGDGWDTVVDDIALSTVDDGAGNIVGITLDTEVPMDAVVSSAAYAGALSGLYADFTRITVFSPDGKFSNSFPLTYRSGHTCLWTEVAVTAAGHNDTDYNGDGRFDTNALPVEFSGAVGRVMIESRRAADFNWLLTVRRGSDGRASGVDVVIIFGSGRNPESEHAYPTVGIDGDFNIDSSGDGNAANDVDGGMVANQFRVQFTYNKASDPEPFLKRGAYLLDIVSARWYRIANYSESTDGAGVTTVTIRTESEIVETTAPGSGVVLLPGVVEVYPLGTFSLPEEMTPLAF